MPTFDTPEPITVAIDLAFAIGNVTIVASDRVDTAVEVAPTNESARGDAKAAAQTRVDYTRGRLLVESMRQLPRQTSVFGKGGSIDVRVELPSGSHVQVDTAHGGATCEGRLGECRFTTYYGDIVVDRASGHVEAVTGHGEVRIGHVEGTAMIQNDKGTSTIGEVTGALRVSGVKGDVIIGRAHAGVAVRTATGNVRVAEVARGSVVLTTAAGELEIGIREGTAAWLDVNSTAGRVRNSMEVTDGPGQTAETVDIRARTYTGDIVIHRAVPAGPEVAR